MLLPPHQRFTAPDLAALEVDADAWRTGTLGPLVEPPPPLRRELTTAERRALTYDAAAVRRAWGA